MKQASFKNVDDMIIKKIIQENAQYTTNVKNKFQAYAFEIKDQVVISVYNNKTVLFQGKNIDFYISKYNLATTINTSTEQKEFDNFDILGCDEVGVGDFFGPIVTCSAFLQKNDIKKFSSIFSLVKDSKKISDQQIYYLFSKLKDIIKYSVHIMDNKTYNSYYQKYKNINTLKCIAHNNALLNFYKENQNLKIDYTVMDQFVAEKLYYNHLNRNDIYLAPYNILFTTKAESKSLAVACASIIARFYFLKTITDLEQKYNIKIFLGANNHVKNIVNILKQEKANDINMFLKLNFNSEIKK